MFCFSSFVCAHNGRGGNRTLDLVLIRDLLSTTELRASGAEGSRTLTIPLKRRKRCRYATTPSVEWAYAFESRGLRHVKFSSVFSCPRWSRTTAGDVSDRYASVTTPDSREGGSRTRDLVLPRHARHRSSSSRFCFSVSVTRVGFEPYLFSLKG